MFLHRAGWRDDYGERQGESESIMYSRTYTAHKTIDLQASSYAMMSPEHEVSSFGGDPSGPRPVERVGLSSLWFAKVLGRDIARAHEFWQSIPVSDYTSFQTGSLGIYALWSHMCSLSLTLFVHTSSPLQVSYTQAQAE